MSRMRTLTYGIAITVLCACSSAPKVHQRETPQVKSDEKQIPVALTAQQYLQQARISPLVKQKRLLLDAATAFMQEGDCNSSLKLLKPLLPRLEEFEQQDQAHLLQARCLANLGHWQLAEQSLQAVSQHLQLLPKRLALSAEIAQQQGDTLTAANNLAELSTLQPDKQSELQEKIWHLVQQTPDKAISSPGSFQGPLSPWLQLARIARTNSGEALSSQLLEWQTRHNLPLPADLQPLLQSPSVQPQRIAVILPLSGRLANQGEALKEGILAAYFADQSEHKAQVSFVDTLSLNEQTLANMDQQFDFVIGPLLKENLDTLLPQLPDNLPVLALNRPDQPVKQASRYFYSLAPEDEAEQLAELLSQKGYKSPLVVNADRAVFQRMASSFTEKWQSTGRPAPKQVSFTDNKSMRNAMEGLLDVSHSKQRIKQVERLAKEEVHTFARNRRDVDAIVIFANAAQTELLNPIIESSISPFAEMVPVYASSRSFSQELGGNSLRDLRHMTFVDMPWMLPGGDSVLKELNKQLWPQRNDGQNRLFAMGYDAYRLLPTLVHMAQVPQMTIQGLTGTLRMDEHHQLRRSLPLGKVEQEKVVRLAMD
ncbi:penicillin-binding protein activator [Bowmanella yangjiangensis]|uniref:Penicillin-binding protein activator n=1 Tax=Bowmanella yangjiangensis TaxID=2811230 RepID=A0ABS3CVH9_9ALTE|nr:penicillin-binding protein activator [Bowmanella yangjiangensis]MBN7821090.1 penicillin-binding protein activator [Bowmanella yangjiangensis]